ncbi:MAG: FeoB-associated Cys-rich membrane protein [Ruminococcaceae bacterium]|nr:FeoB-associated Cys-rich membrane protein [Oscillospiraceae bacterium]
MFQFILDNIGTIAVSLLLLGIVCAIIIRSVRNKRQGKTSCGCGCSSCAMSCLCQNRGQEQDKQ